jgi:type VI secretion system protein ImpH
MSSASPNKDKLPAASLPPQTQSVPFFAALRKIQSAQGALIGRDTRPAQEPVRLRAEVALAYPATELAKATTDSEGRVTLEVSFLGLFGPSGALPQHYTQTIIDRVRHKDHGLRNFLDLFNHRWLSHFYRAWEKHDYPSAFQTAHSLGEEDTVTQILWSLIGFGTAGQRQRLRLEDKSLLHYCGLLADPRVRPTTLANILSDWFQVSVEVVQFFGQWIRIPTPDQTCLNPVRLGESCNNRLGIDAVAGDRVWNVENRFRLRIGPLGLKQFRQFSPTGELLPAFVALARTYVGPQFEFDIQVVLCREQVPALQLGNALAPSCLGWNSWLGEWPHARDPEDAIFELEDELTFRN